jgi:hypothetical protein
VEGIEGVSGDWVRARGDRGGPYDGGIGSVGWKGEREQERAHRVGGSPRTWSRIRVAFVGVSHDISAPICSGGGG